MVALVAQDMIELTVELRLLHWLQVVVEGSYILKMRIVVHRNTGLDSVALDVGCNLTIGVEWDLVVIDSDDLE